VLCVFNAIQVKEYGVFVMMHLFLQQITPRPINEMKNEECQRMQSCFLVKSSQDGLVTFMALYFLVKSSQDRLVTFMAL
jgi:hypothetical protein